LSGCQNDNHTETCLPSLIGRVCHLCRATCHVVCICSIQFEARHNTARGTEWIDRKLIIRYPDWIDVFTIKPFVPVAVIGVRCLEQYLGLIDAFHRSGVVEGVVR